MVRLEAIAMQRLYAKSEKTKKPKRSYSELIQVVDQRWPQTSFGENWKWQKNKASKS